ncbi:MAG: hypothetical protein HY658_14285 [Actinobacteria bacterium]|nr:hypothetical protein [Actinomycetota bacterium]
MASRGSPIGRALAVLASATLIGLFAAGQAAGHSGNTGHLWNQHIEPLGEPGTINDAGNPLHWTKLKGVPGAFADGIDAGTQAGFGLIHGRPGQVQLQVRTDQIQARVNGSCGVGSAIGAVDIQGGVTCNPMPMPEGVSNAFYHFDDVVGAIDSEGLRSVGALNLPPGQYIVWAKLVIRWLDLDRDRAIVHCELHVGGDFDVARVSLLHDRLTDDTVPMMVIGGSDDPLQADVLCRDDGTDARGTFLKIVAIPVGSVAVNPPR